MGRGRNITLELVREEFKQSGRILLEDKYVNAKTKMRCICVCGKETYINYNNFLQGKTCKECKKVKLSNPRKNTLEIARKIFEDNNCTLLEDEYWSTNKPMRYRCECGRESYITLNNIRLGQRCRQCYIDSITGSGSHLYKPELTEEHRLIGRNDPYLREWRKKVFERDNFKCQYCGWGKGDFQAHHIAGYADNKDQRYDINNGITLCKNCHQNFHKTYGYRWFYDFEFGDWMALKHGLADELST